MVLFLNVFLTGLIGNKFTISMDRGNLNTFDKLDITKYALVSLSTAYSWKRVILNIELDKNIYSNSDLKSLEEFVYTEFKDTDLIFSPHRIKKQDEWIDICDKINDDFVLYLGNHDHVFIDSDNKYLQSLVSMARENYGKYTTISTSHWPEAVRWAKSGYIELDTTHPTNMNSNYKIDEHNLYHTGICLDSLNIITTELFKDWILNGDWGNTELLRTDGVVSVGSPSIADIKNHIGIPLPTQEILTPYKEQFRHFDGYMHQMIGNDICPALTIPDGFFESEIKVRYGYDDYKNGWVNLNPKKPYYASHKDGTDDKIVLEDIPLFWKNRIVEIDSNPNVDNEEMIQHRLHNILGMLYSDDRYNSYIDKELEIKILNTHLNNYKQYELEH